MTQELRTRIFTAIFGAPLLLYLVYLGGAILFVAVAALSCVGFLELRGLLTRKGFEVDAFFGFVLGLYILISTYTGFPSRGNLVVFAVLLLIVFIQEVASRGPSGVMNALVMPGAIYYSFGFPSFVISLRSLDHGRDLTILLFLVVWCIDTAAYFGGMAFGRKKLAPGLSPNKTVEGAVTAVAAGTALGALLSRVLGLEVGLIRPLFGGLPASPLVGALIGLTTAVTGMFGDLVESALKRFAGVKDSGNIIPGHGGVLDRFDSLFFAAPFVYFLWVMLVGRPSGPW